MLRAKCRTFFQAIAEATVISIVSPTLISLIVARISRQPQVFQGKHFLEILEQFNPPRQSDVYVYTDLWKTLTQRGNYPKVNPICQIFSRKFLSDIGRIISFPGTIRRLRVHFEHTDSTRCEAFILALVRQRTQHGPDNNELYRAYRARKVLFTKKPRRVRSACAVGKW